MERISRLIVATAIAGLVPGVAVAQMRVEAVTPLPAWCGGSYSITGGLSEKDYVAAVKAGQPLGPGTNFGACGDIVTEVRGADGKLEEVRVPTYPAFPSSQVNFEPDGRVVFRSGEVDKDGKPIVVELKLPEIPRADLPAR